MGRLRDFFERHKNVFSYTTDEVDGGSGNEDMLVEEYGERAVEAEQPPSALVAPVGRGMKVPYPAAPNEVSYDEIADGDVPEDQDS